MKTFLPLVPDTYYTHYVFVLKSFQASNHCVYCSHALITYIFQPSLLHPEQLAETSNAHFLQKHFL